METGLSIWMEQWSRMVRSSSFFVDTMLPVGTQVYDLEILISYYSTMQSASPGGGGGGGGWL